MGLCRTDSKSINQKTMTLRVANTIAAPSSRLYVLAVALNRIWPGFLMCGLKRIPSVGVCAQQRWKQDCYRTGTLLRRLNIFIWHADSISIPKCKQTVFRMLNTILKIEQTTGRKALISLRKGVISCGLEESIFNYWSACDFHCVLRVCAYGSLALQLLKACLGMQGSAFICIHERQMLKCRCTITRG